MRTYDLTPFYRSTVGFDRFFSLLDQAAADGSPGYPPYNIERTGENAYRISVAVSGFSEGELSIVAKENTLTIKGEKSANENSKEPSEVLYRGIAARAFERVFQLADFVLVKNASLENGLLHVDLVREIPEAKKPRNIPITSGAQAPAGGRRRGREGRRLNVDPDFGNPLPRRRRPGKPGRFFVPVQLALANDVHSRSCTFGISWVGRICGADGFAATAAAPTVDGAGAASAGFGWIAADCCAGAGRLRRQRLRLAGSRRHRAGHAAPGVRLATRGIGAGGRGTPLTGLTGGNGSTRP